MEQVMQISGRGCSNRGNNLCKGPGAEAWPGVIGTAGPGRHGRSEWRE